MSSVSTEWRRRNPEKAKAWSASWYRRNRERLLAYAKERYRRQSESCTTDPDYYAAYRRSQRNRCYTWRLKHRGQKKSYKARSACQIPEWATKGQRIMDTQSPWLIENRSAEQKGYAIELFTEWKKGISQ